MIGSQIVYEPAFAPPDESKEKSEFKAQNCSVDLHGRHMGMKM